MKWTPLMFSVKNDDLNNVKILIKNGAEINCQNKIGYTPIMYAVINNNDKILTLLLSNLSTQASFIDTCYDKTIWDYVKKKSKCEMILKMYAKKYVKNIIKNENKYLCKGVLHITCEYLGFKY
jgi:ankyrin repeat protein